MAWYKLLRTVFNVIWFPEGISGFLRELFYLKGTMVVAAVAEAEVVVKVGCGVGWSGSMLFLGLLRL